MAKKKRQPTKQERLEAAAAQHAKFLARLGITQPKGKRKGLKSNFTDLAVTNPSTVAATSDRIPGGVTPTKDLFHAHKWKRDQQESEATMAEIKKKAASIGPAFNKGPIQYLPFNPADARKQ